MVTVFIFFNFLIQLFYFVNWSFKTVLFISGIFHKEKHTRLPKKNLPRYTILVPIYKEHNVVNELVKSLHSLQYLKDRLLILILLEEDDIETINAVNKATKEFTQFKALIIPNSKPKTKPKACNYALEWLKKEKLDKGYLTIYDAEDRPESDQLIKVVQKFSYLPKEYIVIQAKLNYFNKDRNLLTKWFTSEYTFWFDFLLPGLDVLNLTIPLGGTSNHFKLKELIKLGGWNSWNVTEDAELGIRLSQKGYKTAVIQSTTWEEACSKVLPWIKQRTRWTKGYWLTYIDYLKKKNNMSLVQKLSVHFFIGLTPVVNLLYIPMNLLFFLYYFSEIGVHLFPGWIKTFALINLIVGNLTLLLLISLSNLKRGNRDLMLTSFLFPIYWCLHSISAFRAFYQSYKDPYKWEKTPHGL